MVHGGVDLHVVVGAADVARERRHDAGGHGATETERIADRQNPLADAGRLIRELDDGERLLRLDLQKRDVGALIRARDGGVDLFLIVEADLHLRRAVDHVTVCYDVAVRRDDEARAGCLARTLLLGHAVGEILEQLVQGMIVGKPGDALELT